MQVEHYRAAVGGLPEVICCDDCKARGRLALIRLRPHTHDGFSPDPAKVKPVPVWTSPPWHYYIRGKPRD